MKTAALYAVLLIFTAGCSTPLPVAVPCPPPPQPPQELKQRSVTPKTTLAEDWQKLYEAFERELTESFGKAMKP
jgi:hypothetical protein